MFNPLPTLWSYQTCIDYVNIFDRLDIFFEVSKTDFKEERFGNYATLNNKLERWNLFYSLKMQLPGITLQNLQ